MIYSIPHYPYYERKLITGGPYTLERDGVEYEITVDLHWLWEEGEPGSSSIQSGWCLDYVEAYDDADAWELTSQEELDALQHFGHP
jgi:hypothetical protein